jgi:hypothetical protein
VTLRGECCVCGTVDVLTRARCDHVTLPRTKRPSSRRSCPRCWANCDACGASQCGLCHASGPCPAVLVPCKSETCEHQAVLWPTDYCNVCAQGPYHSQCLTKLRDGWPVCETCGEFADGPLLGGVRPGEKATGAVADLGAEIARLTALARAASTPTVRVEFTPAALPGEFLAYCGLFVQRDCSLLTL